MKNGSSGLILVYESKYRLRGGFRSSDLHETPLLAPDSIAAIQEALRKVEQLPFLALVLSFWLFYVFGAVQLLLIAGSIFYAEILQLSLLNFFILALFLHLRRQRLKRCICAATEIAAETELHLNSRFRVVFSLPQRTCGRPFTMLKLQVFVEKRPFVELLPRLNAASPAVETCRKSFNEVTEPVIQPCARSTWKEEELTLVAVDPSCVLAPGGGATPPMLAPDFSDIVFVSAPEAASTPRIHSQKLPLAKTRIRRTKEVYEEGAAFARSGIRVGKAKSTETLKFKEAAGEDKENQVN